MGEKNGEMEGEQTLSANLSPDVDGIENVGAGTVFAGAVVPFRVGAFVVGVVLVVIVDGIGS